MATYAFPKKINRYKLSTLFLLLIFLICLFFFNRRALDPKFFLDTDRISQTPPTPPLSPPRSTEFREELSDLTPPVSSSSSADDNADGSVAASSKLTEPELQEEIKEEDVSSKSDFDDKATRENEKPEDSESQDDFSDSNGEPISSDEEKVVPVLSESDPRDEARDDSGDRTDEPVSSGEETTVPNSSESGENGGAIDNAIVEKLRNCDIYKGTWVKDEDYYPLYKPGSCPYVDDGFNCQSNGRPDSGYTQWRWKPDECDLPRFNATDFLVRLRGKRLMLVGDSMNRNQFESLLCLLREGLPDKSRMYETRGFKITKGRGYYIFKFTDYDCTVEFVRSHFLVREGVRINGQGNSNPTLSIDRIDKTAARWLRADILVFNTGHWWTHGKTSRGKNYYKEGDYVYPKFDPVEAYRRAITTWATWIKNNIKLKKLVFYRGYSTAHFRGGDWDSGGSCRGETEPVVQGAIIDSYPQKMTIVEEVFKKTQVPVVLLNVTRLTNYRKDGHPSVYGKNVTLLKKVSTRRQDCSHWCLPGVPDAWNELIYATLVAGQK